ENQGTTAKNSGIGGSALDATLTNIASPPTSTSGWVSNGRLQSAINFDGSNDRITTSGVDVTRSDWTMSAWVNPRSFNPAWSRVFDAGASGGYSLGFANGQLKATVTNVTDAPVDGGTVPINQWSYIAATLDKAT